MRKGNVKIPISHHIRLCTYHNRKRFKVLWQALCPRPPLLLLFFPRCCWRLRQRWVTVLLSIPKGACLITYNLPCNETVCLFSAVFVYHNSLFELEASTTAPTGKHQVLNAIPRHACLSNLRSNECQSLSPGGPFCHVCVYEPTLAFWWLHLRDLPKCVCFFPKVVPTVSALGLFTSKCFCDSPKQHETPCSLFPFLFFFSSLFVTRKAAFVI